MEPAAPRSVTRADAQRNRERILAAAGSAFAEADDTVSMAEISRRAGVGMATLYRNFPNRLLLLEALYAAEADAAFTATDSGDDVSAADALRTWLEQFFAFAASKKHVGAELLNHVTSDSPVFNDTRTRVIAAGRPLFEAAQELHAIRGDITIEQVLQMLVAVAAIDGDRDDRAPMFHTILDGLCPGGTEVVVSPVTTT